MAQQQQTLWSLLVERCRISPDAICLEDDDGNSLSFGQLHAKALSTAQALRAQGIQPGDRVAWQLPTWWESVVLSLALARLGAQQIPLFPTLRENELNYLFNMAAPRLYIHPGSWKGHDFEAMATDLVQRLQSESHHALETLALGRGQLPTATTIDPDLLAPQAITPPEDSLPLNWIFCTSGTTSAPKAALHNDTPFVTVGYAMNALLEISSLDVAPIFFPYTHVGGLMWLASCLISGCTLLLAESFDADAIAFAHDKGTTIGGAGTVFHLAYLQQRQQHPEAKLFANIRSFTGGGAPKPPELHYDMKREFGGAGIISGYGLTECPIISMNSVRDPDQRLAETEGRLLPGMQVRIVGPDGEAAQEGEIRVKGPHLCQGFLDPELNISCFDEQGYFKTGDIGHLDSEGWLTISGRLKDVIIRKGENISVKKIEDLLFEHPAIAEVAVVGLPDASRGEMACAVIVCSGQSAPDLPALREFCLQRGLVIQEVPERLEVVDTLPRNASGKVLKNELRDHYSQNS